MNWVLWLLLAYTSEDVSSMHGSSYLNSRGYITCNNGPWKQLMAINTVYFHSPIWFTNKYLVTNGLFLTDEVSVVQNRYASRTLGLRWTSEVCLCFVILDRLTRDTSQWGQFHLHLPTQVETDSCHPHSHTTGFITTDLWILSKLLNFWVCCDLAWAITPIRTN